MSGTAKTAAAIAAAVAVLAAAAWLLLGGDRGDPERRGAEVQRFTIDSRAVPGRQPAVTVAPGAPDPGAKRGMLVFLHGLGGDSETHAEDEAFLDALARVNESTDGAAPIVVFPEGDSSFWHDRETGEWGRYLTDEVIPLAARRTGADPRRVAVGGISMGGYGALNLAQKNPDRFCAVGGHSPGLFRSFDEALEVAFDDRKGFEANDVIAAAAENPSIFAGTPVWLDAGRSDFFHGATLELASILESTGETATGNDVAADGAPTGSAPGDLTARLDWPGGHDDAYWDSHWADYLEFYADALRECEPATG